MQIIKYAFQKKEKREGMTANNVITATGNFEFQTCQKNKDLLQYYVPK